MPNPSPSLNPRTKRPELHTSPNQQKENRNDRRAQLPARPCGSTGTSRARRRVSREGTPRRARVPPIDYRDGLSPCLTNSQETDITTVIQRRRQHPRRTAGRDCSEQVVAIRRNGWSRSSVCPIHSQVDKINKLYFVGRRGKLTPLTTRGIAPLATRSEWGFYAATQF